MAEYYDPVPSKIRFSAALGLFIGGFVFFAVFFAIPSHPNYLALPGWTAWIFAYFIVVAQNFKRKTPIPMLGVRVRFEERPYLHRLSYGWLFFVGGFALIVTLIFILFPK